MKFLRVLLFSLLLIPAVGANPESDFAVEIPESLSDTITLGRFSMDRVAKSREHLTKRMRRIRGTINGVLVTAGLATVGGISYKIWKSRQDSANNADATENAQAVVSMTTAGQPAATTGDAGAAGPAVDQTTEVSLDDAFKKLGQLKDDATDAERKAYELNLQRIQLAEQLHDNKQSRARERQRDRDRAKSNDTIMGRAMSPLKWALAIGVGGLILTTGQHVLRVLSGTLEESLNLWWHGYMYWYNTLEQRLRNTMSELRESLHQARKVAQSGIDAAMLKRQMRHTAPGHTQSTHYRADITMMYQISVGMLERLVALMYIIAPQENHTAIYRNVRKMARLINGYTDDAGNYVMGLGDCLETDLNENTHGALTHYSNKTIDLYHEVFESIQIFLTTYRVYLKG